MVGGGRFFTTHEAREELVVCNPLDSVQSALRHHESDGTEEPYPAYVIYILRKAIFSLWQPILRASERGQCWVQWRFVLVVFLVAPLKFSKYLHTGVRVQRPMLSLHVCSKGLPRLASCGVSDALFGIFAFLACVLPRSCFS